jgi:hypothetical protein
MAIHETDTWQEVLGALERLADRVAEHGPECHLVGDCCTSGSMVKVEHDPEMTVL